MRIEDEILANPILREVSSLLSTPYQKSLLELQTAKGIVKYKRTVNVDDYSIVEWIDHNIEELIDSLVYYKTLEKSLLKESKDPHLNYHIWSIEKGINSNLNRIKDLEYIRSAYSDK